MMDILNFIKDNNLPIILGIGLIGGVIYLMKKLIEAGIAKDLEDFKDKNSEKIEKLKSELENHKQQLEHIHQVSQPTYQHLFEKKITLYQDIIKIISLYKSKQRKFKEMDNYSILDDSQEFDYLEGYIETLNKVKNIFEKNKLFFSNELVEKYEILMKEFQSFDFELYEIHIEYQGHKSIDEQYDYKDDIKLIYVKIYETTQSAFITFDNVLDNDIQKIKDKINLD